LRWQVSGPAIGPAQVHFKEAYLWNLGVEASGLNALIHYQISGAGVAVLEVDLPPELEARGAEVRPIPTRAAPGVESTALRLRDWRVTGAEPARVLRLEFTRPIAGEFQVLLDLVPRAPLPATVTLPVPTPRGKPSADSSFLAYRARGLEARRLPDRLLLVTGIRNADFAPFWPA